MDLKALMQKLETINKTEILTESEKKETTWTDKSGKKHPATQVKGDKYTGKDAEKEEKKSKKDDLDENYSSAIAKAIVEEFGYELEEETIEEAEAVPNPWTNDPVKSAAWSKLSPEDQKWLGGADPTDEFILARAPNKGKPPVQKVDPNQADRDDAELGAAMTANAAAATPAAAPAAPAADPAKIARFKALLSKLQAQGGAAPKAESISGDDQILAMIRNVR